MVSYSQVSLVVLLVLFGTTTAHGSTAQAKCVEQNGCVCNSSAVTVFGGKTVGTCTSCWPQFHGVACEMRRSPCFNDGHFNDSTAQCQCSRSYTGDRCQDIQCVNSVGGTGPYSVAPPNSSNMCDKCRDGMTGMTCTMCENDAGCGSAARCNKGPIAVGDRKHFECPLPDMFRPFLKGIDSKFVVNCEKPNGFEDNTIANGTCSTGVYRIEKGYAYQDPFFFCSLYNCSMDVTEETIYVTPKGFNPNLHGIQHVGEFLLLFFCLMLILNVMTKSERRKRRVFQVAGGGLLLVLVLFVAVMTGAMHYRSPARNPVDVKTVKYTCLYTNCTCADNPKHNYQPTCQGSFFDKAYLPTLKGKTTFECHLNSSFCELTLGNFALPSNCSASECVPNTDTPAPSTGISSGGTNVETFRDRYTTDVLVIALVLVTILGFWLHWYQSKRVRLAAMKEFIARYGDVNGGESSPSPIVDTPPSAHSSPLGPSPDPSRGRFDTKELSDPHRQGNINNDNTEDEEGEEGDRLVTPPPATLLRRDSPAQEGRRGEEGEGQWSPERGDKRPSPTLADDQKEKSPSILLEDATHSDYSTLNVDHLCYAVRSPEDRSTKCILDNVSFEVHSGEMLALMGPSGAGKTSLLDLLALHSKAGTIDGCIKFDSAIVRGKEKHSETEAAIDPDSVTDITTTNVRAAAKRYKSLIGYVAQEETLLPSLTVRETITYAARFKLPAVFSRKTINGLVNDVIKALRLQHCANTIIGDEKRRGLSGGEKRRVSIATELVGRPKILFLDEPTSGLDSASANHVMEAVAAASRMPPSSSCSYFNYRVIVVFSIHQPSSDIFQLFDKILLLAKGSVIYFGAASAAVTSVIRTSAFTGTPTTNNPADFLLRVEDKLSGPERARLIAAAQGEALARQRTVHKTKEEQALIALWVKPKFHLDSWQQFETLCSRTWATLFSSYYLIAAHAAVTFFVGLLMSLLYSSEPLDLGGSLNRAGSLTFLLLVVAFVSISSLDLFLAEKRLFLVERENRFYKTGPYYIAKLLFDLIPLRIIPTLVLGSLIYFSMGFRTDDANYYLWFLLILTLFSLAVTCTILCVAMLAPSFGSGALVASVLLLWHFVFGGLMVQADTMPPGFKPFQLFSPFFLAFEALLVNELDGRHCTFAPRDAQGHPSSSNIPLMCVQYLYNLGLQPKDFTRDVVLLLVWFVVFLLLGGMLLRYAVRLQR